MTNHPPPGLIDVFASTIPSLSFRPALHVNYAETVLAMRDGLPKFKDFPAEIGGSSEQMTGVAVFDLKLQQNEKQPRPRSKAKDACYKADRVHFKFANR
jgi:predicted type IV restriction endonuclease